MSDSGSMEINGLNAELNDMLNRGQLSGRKIAALLKIREMVNQLATCDYVPASELAELKERFGTEPNITTWGDYFQCELASSFFDRSDDDFVTLVDTVRFDLVSAIQIFHGKDDSYHQMVREEGLAAHGSDPLQWGEREEQAAHLYILQQYFGDMQLDKARLSQQDIEWYESCFVEPAAGSAAASAV